MAPYRNIGDLIKSLKYISSIYLVFQGTIGDEYLKDIQDLCRKTKLSDRVFFLPPVPYDQIPSSCYGADFGIFSCSMQSKSMYSALPNKFFEYIAGGIPMISEDIPLMREYIERYDISFLMNSEKHETIVKVFEGIVEKDTLERVKRNIDSLKETLISEVNKENKSIYEKIYGVLKR